MDEQYLLNRAQTAEAQLATLKEAYQPALERVKAFKANFGVKERSNGNLDIDYDKFLNALGVAGFLELRKLGDEKFKVSGNAGEKPHLRVA